MTIKIEEKSRIFLADGNAFFSVRTLEHCWEKALNLKRTEICTNRCDSKPMSFFLSDDITHLNQLYLFGHVARASPIGWLSESFSGGNKKTVAGWKWPKERLRITCTRSAENDLAQLNIGLHSNLRQAKDRSCWRIATVKALAWHLLVMTVMIFMIVLKITWLEKA